MESALSTIENDITARVASAIKDRRERLGWPLRVLADRSGVSSSMISDVERGVKSPTISILGALAQALEMPICDLVDHGMHTTKRIHTVRAGDRLTFVEPTSGARREGLCSTTVRTKIEFLRYEVPPHSIMGPFEAHAGGALEHMYLAAGTIRAIFGEESVVLQTGDSCTCIADTSHSFDNRESEVSALIYIVVEG